MDKIKLVVSLNDLKSMIHSLAFRLFVSPNSTGDIFTHDEELFNLFTYLECYFTYKHGDKGVSNS